MLYGGSNRSRACWEEITDMKVTNYSENVAMLRALKEIAKVTSQLGPDRPSAQYMAETANRIALSAIDAARGKV